MRLNLWNVKDKTEYRHHSVQLLISQNYADPRASQVAVVVKTYLPMQET